jgi:hypothetical protein
LLFIADDDPGHENDVTEKRPEQCSGLLQFQMS